MANKTEDREGKLFIGFMMLGIGVGLLVSAITDNWVFMAPGSVIGLGLGFIGMSVIGKK